MASAGASPINRPLPSRDRAIRTAAREGPRLPDESPTARPAWRFTAMLGNRVSAAHATFPLGSSCFTVIATARAVPRSSASGPWLQPPETYARTRVRSLPRWSAIQFERTRRS
jgi:hypothetical protein